MVYICIICTFKQPPLLTLTLEHWKTLEAIVSSCVDWERVKTITPLLACLECLRLLQTVAAFQNTAVKGVNHVLSLLPSVQPTQDHTEPDPLLMPIKIEPSFIELELEQLKVKPEGDIKLEPGSEPEAHDSEETESALSDCEDDIPLTTVRKMPTDVNSFQRMQKPHMVIHAPVEKDEFKTATFTRGPGRPAAAGVVMRPVVTSGSSPAAVQNMRTNRQLDSRGRRVEPLSRLGIEANAEQFQTCQKVYDSQMRLVKVIPADSAAAAAPASGPVPNHLPNRLPPLPKLAMKPATNTAACARRPAELTPVITSVTGAPPKPAQHKQTEQPTNIKGRKSSHYYIWVLNETEMLAEREAARRAPEFAEALHKCDPCLLVFKSDNDKDVHDRMVHMRNDNCLCFVCGHRASTPLELRAHAAQHDTRYCCVYCRFRTRDESVIKQHRCDATLAQWQPSNIIKGLFEKKIRIKKPLKCKECYSPFSNEDNLKRHVERRHSQQFGPFICNICKKQFKNAKLLYVHTLRHNRKPQSVDTINPELFCAECAKQFESPSAFKEHMLTLRHARKEDWQFECDTCGGRFPNKTRIEMHMQMVHLKLEPYKCGQCSRGFNGRGALRRHWASHEPERPAPRAHVCHVCAKTFTIKKSLREHLLKHAGLRPHQCPHCPATFTYSAALYTHNRLKHLKIKKLWKKKTKKTKADS